jgi:hypothetical protein
LVERAIEQDPEFALSDAYLALVKATGSTCLASPWPRFISHATTGSVQPPLFENAYASSRI